MTYLKHLSLIACAAALAACAVSPSANDQGAKADTTVVNYTCQDGQPAQLTYHNDTDSAELQREGVTLTLQKQVSASGFIYGDGSNTIFGKGPNLTLELAQAAPVQCEEAGVQN